MLRLALLRSRLLHLNQELVLEVMENSVLFRLLLPSHKSLGLREYPDKAFAFVCKACRRVSCICISVAVSKKSGATTRSSGQIVPEYTSLSTLQMHRKPGLGCMACGAAPMNTHGSTTAHASMISNARFTVMIWTLGSVNEHDHDDRDG